MSDKKLIAIFLKGDNSGITELLRRHKQHIYTSIYFLVRDKEKADDLFHDTFILIVDALREGKYIDQGYFRAWAVRIAKNLFIDEIRKNRRRKFVRDTDEYSCFDFIPADQESKDKEIVRSEEEKVIRELIEKVPLKFRQVLIMRHYGEMSFKEIANALNITTNTALGRMHYALKFIRKIMKKENIVLR
ncbi:MAG TPA: RNA polymerase sigma factor [Bacteroidia bacterium]|nr:RNA polymerase sigma factor [Bacteroidia bacterium]